MEQYDSLHVWFQGGWHLHLFRQPATGVLLSPAPQAGTHPLDSPRAAPFLAALCGSSALCQLCQDHLGRAPWEMVAGPLPVRGPLPQIEKACLAGREPMN